MLYYERGSAHDVLSLEDLEVALFEGFDKLGARKKVLAIPPDITRIHSCAGELTQLAYRYFGDKLTDVLPALGTHVPMTQNEIERMFGDMPKALFRKHDWRRDPITLGRVGSDYMAAISEGKLNYDWPAEVNRLLVSGKHDLILSIGQVVPHEVIGMANYTKNIFMGTGGAEGINKSHYLGAVYGMERIMGRTDTPVRRLLDHAAGRYLHAFPIVYVQTVVSVSEAGPVTRGLYIGDDAECFEKAAALSRKVNLEMLDEPIKKAVVYLSPDEYKSTWLGNKSIYRTRMAMADEGELIVMAPGLSEFGEDPEIDRLIAKYGYVGSDEVLAQTERNADLKNNLSAAAHLIHGSSEGRFSITYAPANISRQQVEGVNYQYADLAPLMKRYDPNVLTDGYNKVDGEDVFFISNPGLGLWAWQKRFESKKE